MRPLAIVMVGLPARGKTYTAQHIERFLQWRGHKARVFNVGNVRRALVGAQVPHSFFDPDNSEGLEARQSAAETALDELVTWVGAGGEVGIYDATNTTRARRDWVGIRCRDAGMEVLFFEIVCNDADVIDTNIRASKLSNPDYLGMDPDKAVADFRARIAHYAEVYEPVEPEEGSFIRTEDLGRHIELQEIHGYLPGKLVSFAMNLHTVPRPIFLSRHGQSEANRVNRVGGDSPITDKGKIYADELASWFHDHELGGIQVWTSTLQRTNQTAAPLCPTPLQHKALDEIDAGVCDGMTYAEIEAAMPAAFAARQHDKLRYRYPQGESYEDVIDRLEPIIFELERSRSPVLVIAHQAILRALYAYFANHPRESTPHISVPLHTIIKLTPRAYGCDEERFVLGPGVGAAGSSA